MFSNFISFTKIGLSDDSPLCAAAVPDPSESNSTKAHDKSTSHLIKYYRLVKRTTKRPIQVTTDKRDSDDASRSSPATFIASDPGTSRQRTSPTTTHPFFEDGNYSAHHQNSFSIQSVDRDTYPFYDDGDRAPQSHHPSLHYPVQPDSLTSPSSLNLEQQLRHQLLPPREGSQFDQNTYNSNPAAEQRSLGVGTPPPANVVFDSLRLPVPESFRFNPIYDQQFSETISTRL